nr:C40 family peptidase [uncultured Pseudodesulfovibrio sp.]
MFDQTIIQAAMRHAKDEYPREACGLVVGDEYLPRYNSAADPLRDFRITPQAWIGAERKGIVRAVIHSHPDQAQCPEDVHPTKPDMVGQLETDLPWGIVPVIGGVVSEPFFWGEGAPVLPLTGRRFRHGVADCYSLVRDWYRLERGVILKDYPRSDEWWHGEDDLCMDSFIDAGFRDVDLGLEPEVGDLVLMQVCSSKVNHCGLYVGGGLMLHHLTNRLSRPDPYRVWHKTVRRIGRRDRV